MSIALFLWLLVELISYSVASQVENLKRAYNVTDLEPTHLEFPQGSLQVFGNFDTLTFPRYDGQTNFTQGISAETDSQGIIYYSNDTFIKLIDGTSSTRVRKIVPFGSDSFILSGSGDLLAHDLQRQLFYNLSDLSLRPIFDEPLGGVDSILVDYPLVYFGGNFTYSVGSSAGHSLAIWNHTSNSSFLAPFGGFGENSRVNSIVKLDSDSILFSGLFTKLDDQSWVGLMSGNESENDNFTNIEVGSVVPLQLATWDAGSSSSFDASTFVCPDTEKAAWLVHSTQGSLDCSLPFEVFPQKIRIFNSPEDDSGVSLFRIITQPSGGIMNLTYVDPLSGNLSYCDAFCPLLKRSSLKEAQERGNTAQAIRIDNNLTSIQWSETFQDFAFVNNIGVSNIQFSALNSYADSVGLSSFQLYQSAVSVYANNTLNDLGCGSSVDKSDSSLSGGNWHSGSSTDSYLISEVDSSQSDKPRITFNPAVNGVGNYSIKFYTPGCLADNTCSSRSIVNVTIWSGKDNSMLTSALIYQNNQQEKYDQLYFGPLEAPPNVTLEFHSSIYLNNPSNIIVADRVELTAHTVQANETEDDSLLNGMFLYQLSKGVDELIQNSTVVVNNMVNSYAVENFPRNSSLFSIKFNDTLWVGGSVSGVATIELGRNLSILSSNKLNTGGLVEGMSAYSDGILLFGSFNLSSEPLSTIAYNGSFSSFGYLNTSVDSFSNISLHGNELLVFNNEFIFNTTSNDYVSNSTSFALSLWSAGQNDLDDVLFSGAISEPEYSRLNGATRILDNGTLNASSSYSTQKPYMALKLNDTTISYAYRDGDLSRLMLNNFTSPWSWPGTVSFMRYLNDGAILAVGTNTPSGSPQISLLNMTTFEVTTNLTMPGDNYISSAIFFGKNSSLLIGGNYSTSSSQCHDLCLYDYNQNRWSQFGNTSLSGNITEMKLSENYDLLISGHFEMDNRTSINLVSLNITNQKMSALLWGTGGPSKCFIENAGGIFVWNNTSLFNYRENEWKDLKVDSQSISIIDSVIGLDTTSELRKRDISSSDNSTIIVSGRLRSAVSENSSIASLYSSQTWSPYFVAGESNSSAPNMVLFTNEDLSRVYDSQIYLPNLNVTPANTPSSSSATTPTATAASVDGKRRPINRGFVVLIGLALALGTVTVLGVTGVLLALVFKSDDGYEHVVPRTNESEMMETVPPEKLLGFL